MRSDWSRLICASVGACETIEMVLAGIAIGAVIYGRTDYTVTGGVSGRTNVVVESVQISETSVLCHILTLLSAECCAAVEV